MFSIFIFWEINKKKIILTLYSHSGYIYIYFWKSCFYCLLIFNLYLYCLELIDGGSKVVLQTGVSVEAYASAASSVDIILSVVDSIST